jgi:uncharacterized protein DUF2608
MRYILFILFMLSYCTAYSYTEIKQLRDILAHINPDEETLVLLDVDETLVTHNCQFLGDSNALNAFALKNRAASEIIFNRAVWFLKDPINHRLMEHDITRNVVENLQSMVNVRTVTLTARAGQQLPLFSTLQQVGLDFSSAFPEFTENIHFKGVHKPQGFPDEHFDPRFEKGCLLACHANKAEILLAFLRQLKQIDYEPKKIIFVDNNDSHCSLMDRLFSTFDGTEFADVEGQSFCYTLIEDQFNVETAKHQLSVYSEQRILLDDDVATLEILEQSQPSDFIEVENGDILHIETPGGGGCNI